MACVTACSSENMFSLNPGEDAWVFPSETGKTPLGRGNVWRGRIGPKLKAAG
jgi:hypothetical protein